MKEIQKEIIPIGKEDLFIVLDHPNADFDYAIHYHDEYEINLVMGTSGKRFVGDSIESFYDIDLAMIGPRLPHAWRGDTIEGNHVITIQFSDSLLTMPIMERRLFSQIRGLLIEAQKGLSFSKSATQKLKEKILNITRMQGFQTVLEFFSLLNDLAIADRYVLVSNRYDTRDTVMTTKSRRIAKVCEYMEQHYSDDISLSDVAALTDMSPSAFSHFFKSKTNTRFIDYLNELRIAKACNLLTQSSQTISEICYGCGFNNMSNFLRLFKKKKGQTPTEYRDDISRMLIKY